MNNVTGKQKPPIKEASVYNSLRFGHSAVKMCISRTRRKYITIILSLVNSLNSQMDSQFGRDRKLHIGCIRYVCNLEEFGMSHQKPNSNAYCNSSHRQVHAERTALNVYKYHCDILIYLLAMGSLCPSNLNSRQY